MVDISDEYYVIKSIGTREMLKDVHCGVSCVFCLGLLLGTFSVLTLDIVSSKSSLRCLNTSINIARIAISTMPRLTRLLQPRY